jgi:hypothetical protein
MDPSFLQYSWEENARSIRPVLRRALRLPERGAPQYPLWLTEVLLSSVRIYQDLPANEQDAMLESLASVAGMVLGHQVRAQPEGQKRHRTACPETVPC